MLTDPLSDPISQALSTAHRHLAQIEGRARRYPAAVAPFAALDGSFRNVAEESTALAELHHLLQPGESVFTTRRPASSHPGLHWTGVIPCLQMVFPSLASLPDLVPRITVEPLNCVHATEMMDLIAVAYPGYFRPETCRMGRYFGVRDPGGRLVAMGGERLCIDAPGHPPWREVSGLCSHPELAGKGLGTAVLREILAMHRATGASSWLWVTETNRQAAALYGRLGFEIVRRTELHSLRRVPAEESGNGTLR